MLTFLAFADGGGDVVGGDEVVGVGDGRFRHLAQGVIKHNLDAPPGAPVEDFPPPHLLAGHFFKAKRLGAELDVVVVPFTLLPMFVFDGDKSLSIGFHEVGEAGDLQAV